MKSLLLIGGLATRLLPLSSQLAKSLLPVCDRELLHYQIGALARAGIGEIVLAVGHHAEQVRDYVSGYSGLQFHFSEEAEPLGTAGAIAQAAELLGGQPAVVLNADILCDVDIGAVIAQHTAARRPATLMAVAVRDPARYGLLRTRGDAVTGFMEKPEPGAEAHDAWGEGAQLTDGRGDQSGSYLINAGLYVLQPEVVASIPRGRPVSIEREVFPELLEEQGELSLHVHAGMWHDIGTFESYFAANFDLLARRFALGETTLWGARDDCAVFKDLVYLHRTASIGAGADLYHRVIAMAAASIGDNCQLQNTLLLPGAAVGAGSRLSSCLVGPGVQLPAGLHAENRLFIADAQSQAFYPAAQQMA